MPRFQDRHGNAHTMAEDGSSSYRAIVVNAALRRGDFVWVGVEGRLFPMFTCCHCRNVVTIAGVQGDHIVAQAHGGGHDRGNLQILCAICNAADMHHRGADVSRRTRGALQNRGAWRGIDHMDIGE